MINLADMAKMIKSLQDVMKNPAYTEYIKVSARARREKYKAYLDAGFSEQQALELCSKEMF